MPPLAELLKHRTVLASFAVTGLILVGSVAYYLIESAPPALTYVAVTRGPVTEDVTGSGTVSPIENPNLSFVAPGRVGAVNVKVGDKVVAGQVLATLDAGVLSANYDAAQATYAKLVSGPRPVDVAGKQTSVDTAQTALTNGYDALPAVIEDAVANTEDAVHSVDFLFGSFNTVDYPRVNFLTHSGNADKAGQERGALTTSFDALDRELRTLSSSSSQNDLDAALADVITRLSLARDFFTDLSAAANGATPALPGSELGTLSAGRGTVNGIIVSLSNEKQTLATDRLALLSAQNALDVVNAGAPTEDIAVAKAQADAAAAALRQAEVIAPYSGVVASVAVKTGDVVPANAPGVSVIPDSNFEVEIYLSEIDSAKITTGEKADITIDAYGAGTPFSATVSSIDRAPTVRNGVPAYKVTLAFDTTDTKLAVGQGANAIIHVGGKDDALIVPTGAVVMDNNQPYVLKETPSGPVKTPVVVGLIGADSTEIISGLAEGDQVARVAGQ